MKKIIIYTDGGARGNPGPAAAGAVFCNEKKQNFKSFAEFLGEKTNNEAEYLAIILAMKKFKLLFGKKLAKETEIEIRSDSELVVNQLNGKYKVLEKNLQPLFLETWNLRLDFKKVKFKLISRKKNEKADQLVNQLLDLHSKERPLFSH